MAVIADSVIVELFVKVDDYDARIAEAVRRFEDGMERINRKATTTENTTGKSLLSIGSLISRAAGLAGISLKSVLAAVGNLTIEAIQYIGKLKDTADQLGITTQKLQELRYAAAAMGVDQGKLEDGLSSLADKLRKAGLGAAEPLKAFAALGIGIKDAEGRVRTVADVLPVLADRLNSISDPMQRSAVAALFLGESASALAPLLENGSVGINGLSKAAHDLGIVLSSGQVKQAEDAAKKFNSLKTVLEAKIQGAIVDNVDIILDLADAFNALVEGAGAAISTMRRLDAVSTRGSLIASDKYKAAATEYLLRSPKGRRAMFEDLRARRAKGPFFGNLGEDEARSDFKKIIDAAVAAKQKPGPTRSPGKVDASAVDSLLAPSGRSAVPLAKKVEAARQREPRRRGVADELLRIDDEMLAARQQLIPDIIEQSAIERERLTSSKEVFAEDLKRRVNEKAVTAVEAERLQDAQDRASAVKFDLINHRENTQLLQEQTRVATSALDNEQDLLTEQAGLTQTVAERREIELRLLKLAEAKEQLELTRIANDKASSPREVEAANARLKALPGIYDQRAKGVERSNRSAGQVYLDELNPSTGQLSQTIDEKAVGYLQSFNAELDDSVKKALHLHGVFGDIVGDLIDMAIKQALIKPLAESIFGGSGSGGFLSKIGGLFGLGRAALPGGLTPGAGIMTAIPNLSGQLMQLPTFGRASGGYVGGGQMVRVNEGAGAGRAEYWQPQGSGKVIPLGRTDAAMSGGSTNVFQSFTLDARGGITTPELIAQVNAHANAVGQAAMVGGSQMAQTAIARRQKYRLG